MKLTAQSVRATKTPGKIYDGGGLFLLVQPSGSKSWVLRTTINGNRRDIGLGGYPLVSLAQARASALDYRRIARQGGDPTATKTRVPSFQTATEKVLAIRAAKWRPGSKSEADWRASLQTYAHPIFGSNPVDEITSADIMAAVSPIWHNRTVTARRILQRTGVVLRWAIAEGHRTDDPTAAVATALGNNTKRPEHFAALPHRQVAAALAKVRNSNFYPASRLAFEFAVLTAARSGEVRGARWDEINHAEKLWVIPPTRMKAGREHKVPLSQRALEILAEAHQNDDGSGLVFPRNGREIPAWKLSSMAKDLQLSTTLHGMRSAFRDWAAENGVARETAELCLAHRIGSAAELSYMRTHQIGARRTIMSGWSAYLTA